MNSANTKKTQNKYGKQKNETNKMIGGEKKGDILKTIEKVDVSSMESVQKTYDILSKEIETKKKANLTTIKLIFARPIKYNKAIMVGCGGTEQVNGTYVLAGKKNEGYKFIKADGTAFKIERIFENFEDDEAVWAIRFAKKRYILRMCALLCAF